MCKILSGSIDFSIKRTTGMKRSWREAEAGYGGRPGDITAEGKNPEGFIENR